MPLRLARRASRDLDEMFNFGADRWGIEQAERYLSEFWRTAGFIEAYPLAARLRAGLKGEVRVQRFGSHLVVYTVDDDGVLILRVPHGRSDWINDPV